VRIHTETRVEDLSLADGSELRVTALQVAGPDDAREIPVSREDLVFVTNGSHVAGLTTGTMESPPAPPSGELPAAWALWQRLAAKRPGLGNPSLFTAHREDSTWISFTVTDRGTRFAKLMGVLTGRAAGRNGLVTFRASNWLLTITRFHQPNAVDQPVDVFLWWGYGIYPERRGNLIDKPMLECSGREILQEVLHHLGFDDHAEAIIETSTCIPCLMPYAGSVMLCRGSDDRAPVVPEGTVNLAFLGQFCEQPGDVAFTMEYSVRSARTAVHELTGRGPGALPVYRGYLDPAVLWRNLMALRR
jgi:oleate hydratase